MSGTIETRLAGGRGAAWLATLLLVLGCGATGRADQAAPPKSGDTVASEAELTAGPWTATRAQGKPAPVSFAFTPCDPGGRFWLKVANGAGGKPAVESAVVKLNGTEVLGPGAFDARPAELARAVAVRPGENRLEVEERGTPGAALEVSVWAVESCLRVKVTRPRQGEAIDKRPVVVEGKVEGKSPPFGVALYLAKPDRLDLWVPAGATMAVRGEFEWEPEGGSDPGTWNLRVLVTDAADRRATAELTYHVLPEAQDETWRLSGMPESGPAPYKRCLSGTFSGPYRADFEGDGIIDAVGDEDTLAGHQGLCHTYEEPGRYRPRVYIDRGARVFSGRITVTEPPPVARIWSDFVAALQAGDVGKAKRYLLSENLRAEMDRIQARGTLADYARDLAAAKLVIRDIGSSDAYGLLVRTDESGEHPASEIMFGRELWRWGIVSY